MAFAKTYKEEITFAFYCCNVALTIVIFVCGTIYLWHRDRKDQQQELWRKFAEDFKSGYNKLQTAKIPLKISIVKETFGNIQIHKEITGLDVLRYMINYHSHNNCFKTPELDALREDLNWIFWLLSTCASHNLFGTVPNKIKTEFGTLVTDLGVITLPFYKGMQCQTILKCLKYFGSGSDETVNRLINLDTYLLNEVNEGAGSLAYIQFFRFCGARKNLTSYTECRKFRFKCDVKSLADNYLVTAVNILIKLQEELQDEKYLSDSSVRKHLKNLNYTEIDSDNDKLVLIKVLHEVRMYIHLIYNCLKERQALGAKDKRNIKILKELYEHVTKLKSGKAIVTGICDRFIFDLSMLVKSEDQYHESKGFGIKLGELYESFHKLTNIGTNTNPSSSYESTV